MFEVSWQGVPHTRSGSRETSVTEVVYVERGTTHILPDTDRSVDSCQQLLLVCLIIIFVYLIADIPQSNTTNVHQAGRDTQQPPCRAALYTERLCGKRQATNGAQRLMNRTWLNRSLSFSVCLVKDHRFMSAKPEVGLVFSIDSVEIYLKCQNWDESKRKLWWRNVYCSVCRESVGQCCA